MPTHRRLTIFGIFAVLAAVTAGVVWFALPHDRDVTSLAVFLFKLLPFFLAVEAIAWLDPAWIRGQLPKMLLMIATFVLYFLYFVPKILFASEFADLYYLLLTLSPLVILSLAFAFRLGGGRPEMVRRMSWAMILIMVSGSEDFAFLTINPITDPKYHPIPAVWTWASHMTVFIGHPPTKHEAYAFILVHLFLAALVLTVPTRWLRFRRRRPAVAGPTPTSDVEPISPAAPTTVDTAPANVTADGDGNSVVTDDDAVRAG